jgi:hypothetical protein
MKKLYGLVFLLVVPCIDAMQKKTKPHKKFNIHTVQKKNSKKDKTKRDQNCKVKQENSSWMDKRTVDICRKCAILAAFPVVWFSPIFLVFYESRHTPIDWSAVIEY